MHFSFNQLVPRRTTWLRPQPNQESITGAHQEMSRMIEDLLMAIARAPWTSSPLQKLSMAKTEASETDKEVSIVTELPGVSARDVEVSLDDDILTIRAEMKSERAAEPAGKRDYHLLERDYGRVLHSIRLPFSADPKQVEAILQNGLLTVRLAKPQTVQAKVHNIAVRTSVASTQTPNSPTDRDVAAEGALSTGASEHNAAPH